MRILVQKYGGTSVANDESRRRVAERVRDAAAAGWAVIVVVSAMGRAGAPYATDTLLSLVNRGPGTAGESPAVAPAHPTSAPSADKPLPLLPAREHDLLLSCGEVISSVTIAAELRRAGVNAVTLTGGEAGILTNDAHANAAIVEVRPDRIRHYLGLGQVVVVAGFQGATPAGAVTTLGRGGSDITAVAIGGAIGAELVEIYTDVDGIQTADPRLVPQAHTIIQMTYDETSQMAHEGARVLHPRAAEMAARFNLPVRIRSTFSDALGTLVTGAGGESPWGPPCYTWPVTGVTHTLPLAHVSFDSGSGGDSPPYALSFGVLADLGINVDMIAVSPQHCSFVIPEPAAAHARQALAAKGVAAEVRCGLAKVSVVGRGMRDTPGVMARVSQAMRGAGVSILGTSDSLMTISCLVDQDQVGPAVRALHTAFSLDACASQRVVG